MAEGRIRVAYADPPYPGCAKLYVEKTEIDHAALIRDLEAYDAWALSTSSSALQSVLALCPPGIRVMAWVKPFASFKPGITVAYAWEPIIVRGGRKRPRSLPTVRDWVSASITLRKGMVGVKPEAFSRWLFQVLGLRPTNHFVDLFPGSGAVSRAWEAFCQEPDLLEVQHG